MSYKVVMSVKFGTRERYFEFDTCQPPKFTQSARFAEQPIQNGNTVSDHMWLVPSTFTLDGSFSYSGSWKNKEDRFTYDYIAGDDENIESILRDSGLVFTNDRLANIQSFFRWLQRSGTLVSMFFTDSGTAPANYRFTKKENLALESVTWTEGYQSMTFSMSFKEIMEVSTDMFEMIADKLMPALEMPPIKSVSEVIQSLDGLYQTVVTALLKNGYIATDDARVAVVAKEALARLTSAGATGNKIALGSTIIGVGCLPIVFTAIALAIKAVAFSTAVSAAIAGGAGTAAAIVAGTQAAGAAATVPGVGWIVAGVIVAVIGAVVISNAVKKNQAEKEAREKLERGFNLVRDYLNYLDKNGNVKDTTTAELNTTDLGRLTNLLNAVAAEAAAALNDIVCYQLPYGPNSDSCQFAIPIGSTILHAYVTNNNGYSISVEEYATPIAGTQTEKQNLGWAYVTSFSECDNSNYIYYNEKEGIYMYLAALTNEPKTLADYVLFTSSKPMQEINKSIQDAVISVMRQYNYT